MLNTVSIGDIGESIALTKFLKNDCVVSKPVSNNARYDFVVEICGKLYKVQVKTTEHIKDGKMEFATKTTNYRKGSWESIRYSADEIDIFFLYCLENDWCGLYFPEENQVLTALTLRLEPTRNNQTKGIRFAKDYEFEKQFISITQ